MFAERNRKSMFTCTQMLQPMIRRRMWASNPCKFLGFKQSRVPAVSGVVPWMEIRIVLHWRCSDGSCTFFFESNHSACMKLLVSDLWDHAQKVYCRSIEPHITDLYSDYECWVAPSPAPSIAVASKVLKKIQEVETEVGDSGFLVCHIGIDR